MNHLLTRSLCGVLLLVTLSCSKKDDTDPSTPGNGGNPNPTEESVIKVYLRNDATTLDLGSVYPNHKPTMRSFKVSNTGTKALSISSIDLPEGCTFFRSFAATTIEAREVLDIYLHFLPTQEKAYTGQIVVHSDADSGANTLPTTGKGITKTYDYDGNEYHIIKIGNLLWLQENFRGTHYLNGDPIPDVVSFSGSQDDLTYGKFYRGTSLYVYESSGERIAARGGLVEGFGVPFNTDWERLFDALGGTDVAGGKLKQSGTSLWKSPNTGATNETGFTALPAGQAAGGLVNNYKKAALFWSYKFDNPESSSTQRISG